MTLVAARSRSHLLAGKAEGVFTAKNPERRSRNQKRLTADHADYADEPKKQPLPPSRRLS